MRRRRTADTTRSASCAPPLAPLLALLLALLCSIVPGPLGIERAEAHAFLKESDPAANAVLASAPGSATMVFTERLEPSYSRAELYDENGAKVAGTASRFGADPFTLILDLPSGLANGTYSILWRTLSADDGHTAQGYIAFTVGTQADVRTIVPPPASAEAAGPPDWSRAASRWLALLGLACVVAVWPIWLVVLRPAISPAWQLGPRLTRRVRGFAVGAVVLAMVGDVAALVVQALGVGSGGLLAGLTTTLGETRYGSLWLLRVGLLLVFAAALLGVAWWWPRRRPVATTIALLLGAALPIPYSLTSHAAAQPAGAATAVAFDVVHLLGASLWAGGIFLLVAVLPPTLRDLTPAGRRVVLGRALPRFSLLALAAWAVLLVSGLYNAWLQVGNLAALRGTDYGQSLTLKLLLLVPLLGLGAFNLLVVTRKVGAAATEEAATGWSNHFVTAIVAESVLLVLVLAVVGLLIGQPPARETLAQNAGRIAIPLEADGQSGTLYLTPGQTGPNHYRLELGSGHEAHLRDVAATEATLRFELPGQGTGQSEVTLVPAAAGAFEGHGSELSIAGDWTIDVTVRTPGQADWQVSVTQPIATTPPQVDLPPPPPRFGPGGIAGLLLIVGGIAAVVYAWSLGRSPTRREAAGLGSVAVAIGAVLLLQARVPEQATAQPGSGVALAAPDQAAVVRGAPLFQANCVACHGTGGKGDGPAAAGMTVPPADLAAPHAMAHSDADLAYWIANGISVGGMPGFKDKLTDAQIADVVAFLRDIQRTALAARDAPGAEGCQVAPRSLAAMRAWAGTPAPTPRPIGVETTPDAAGAPVATPLPGEPADAGTIQQITETVRQLVACSNAGDTMRRLALYSDRQMQAAYPDGPTDALVKMAATPVPLLDVERVALLDIRDVRRLPDGRVEASVLIDNPAAHTHSLATPGVNPQRQSATLVFVQEGGGWRVDEVIQ